MEETLQIRVGRNVHRLREDAGITKSRFALMVGISRPYLDAIESGRANITLEVVGRIAAGLDTSPAELLS